jgi:glycosyltransferase involved in cell wall biosynthesis
VENFDASGMQDVTSYARVQIALLGLVRIVFGLLLGVAGAAVLWATANGEFEPTKPGDMPHWWMYVVGSGVAFAAFVFATGGLGRFVSAFARGCYFRAGPDGIAIRLPKMRWFGLYRIVEHRLQWHQIKRFVYVIHRHNLIPMARELQIEVYSGETVAVERHFFSDNIKTIQQKLLQVQATVGR